MAVIILCENRDDRDKIVNEAQKKLSGNFTLKANQKEKKACVKIVGMSHQINEELKCAILK